MRHVTLLGLALDVDVDRKLERFYDRILAAPAGRDAEDLLYGADNPLADALTPEGLPIWTGPQLRDSRWAYLGDAVARCRAAHGELDIASVMGAATWDSSEAARSLGVTEMSVRRLVAAGDLPSVMISGRHMLDRRAVEAHATAGTRAGKVERVPALYLRSGQIDDARLVAVVIGPDGRLTTGDLVRAIDKIDEVVIDAWIEAVILWGKGDKARAIHVRPAHGRPTTSVGLDSLEARGRWELLDKTNNRGEAADMLGRLKARARGDEDDRAVLLARMNEPVQVGEGDEAIFLPAWEVARDLVDCPVCEAPAGYNCACEYDDGDPGDLVGEVHIERLEAEQRR